MCYVMVTEQKSLKIKEIHIMNRNIQGKAKEAAVAHRDNIQKSIQHRMEVARANGDESLLRQLEAESNYYN